jgi:hypothetical protein
MKQLDTWFVSGSTLHPTILALASNKKGSAEALPSYVQPKAEIT